MVWGYKVFGINLFGFFLAAFVPHSYRQVVGPYYMAKGSFRAWSKAKGASLSSGASSGEPLIRRLIKKRGLLYSLADLANFSRYCLENLWEVLLRVLFSGNQ